MSQIHTLWNKQLVEASSLTIVNGAPVDMLVSAPISNLVGTSYNSARVTLKYEELSPQIVLGSFYISAVLEKEELGGQWVMTGAYQFTPLRRSTQASERHIIIQPNMDTFNAGIDDVIWPATSELCRVSRTNGILPEQDIRVRVFLTEQDVGGANAFVSVKVTGELERYHV